MPKSAPRNQLPEPGRIFLDHVGWMVPDMGQAAAVFERLGFPLTPYSVHGDRDAATGALKPVGTANRLAMLERGYLEILAPVEGIDTPVSRHFRKAVAHHVGVHLLAFAVHDASAAVREIAARDVPLQSTVDLRRSIEAENGQQTEVAFTVVGAAFEHFPEARVQVLTHHTPEQMWQSRYLPPDNGITGLLEASIVAANPRESAARFGRFVGRPVERDGSSLAVKLDRGALRFVDARAAAERFGRIAKPPMPAVGAVTLTSRDLDKTRYFLLSQGLRPGAIDPTHLLIDESEALGVHLVIVPG
ncbi:MAG: VOC family protein [Hyphomicrobiaceae bacterium]|nr:VOC family protein [Hyphomicrobiaceae bacterium]